MSLTETPSEITKPRKQRRKRKAAKQKPPSELAGISVTNCATGCNVDGCVISGKPYCAHPHKGGLQGVDMRNDAALGRLKSAKKLLGKAKINLEKL